jgi:hypothetical protein
MGADQHQRVLIHSLMLYQTRKQGSAVLALATVVTPLTVTRPTVTRPTVTPPTRAKAQTAKSASPIYRLGKALVSCYEAVFRNHAYRQLAPLGMCLVFSLFAVSCALAQSVCLPSPRLLTTLPMGGQAGTEVSIAIAGDFLEDVEQLYFSDPRIVAEPEMGEAALPQIHQPMSTKLA